MEDQTIKCKYIFDDDYNPIYVNGAHGGVNPLGEIIINFYLERTALPNSQTFKLKNGIPDISTSVKNEPDDLNRSFIRYIQTGIILSYPSAKEIHRWLGDHLKNMESAKQSKEK